MALTDKQIENHCLIGILHIYLRHTPEASNFSAYRPEIAKAFLGARWRRYAQLTLTHINARLPDEDQQSTLRLNTVKSELLQALEEITTQAKQEKQPEGLVTALSSHENEGYTSRIASIMCQPYQDDINAIDHFGYSHLHVTCPSRGALRFQSFYTALALLAHPLINTNALSADGDTPLHLMCQHEFNDIANILLLSSSIDANIRDKQGATPLHIAAFRATSQLSFLLSHNKIDVNAIDNNSETALQKAARYSGHRFNTAQPLLNDESIDLFRRVWSSELGAPESASDIARTTHIKRAIETKMQEKKSQRSLRSLAAEKYVDTNLSAMADKTAFVPHFEDYRRLLFFAGAPAAEYNPDLDSSTKAAEAWLKKTK